MRTEKITLISSLVEDSLINESGGLISKSVAGPGFFICSAFDQAAVRYKFIHGPTLKAQILVTPSGEFGKIEQPVKTQSTTNLDVDGWCLVSTLFNEWDPKGLLGVNKLFVDIQGFVRDEGDFSRKKLWRPDKDLDFYCLKGTEEEFKYLPSSVVEKQKQKLLIITKGARGAEIFFKGIARPLKANKIADVPNTIGAGDTFFGYFVAAMFKGAQPFEAGNYAIQQTNEFLYEKTVTNNQ